MIDEIVNEVSQKTGLSPEHAKAAAEAVIDFLKARLPAPLASGLDSVLSGGADGGSASGGGGLASEASAALGSFFQKS